MLRETEDRKRERLCRLFDTSPGEGGSLKNGEFPLWVEISLTMTPPLGSEFSWGLKNNLYAKKPIVEYHARASSNAQDLRDVKNIKAKRGIHLT